MKKDTKKSPKTITLDKNRLQTEMKLHPGSGKNQTCIYDDVATLMGYENAKTINNYKYTFPIDKVNKLCAAWGVRSEYLQNIDDWRTQDDFFEFLWADDLKIAQKIARFLDILDLNYKYTYIFNFSKNDFKDSYLDFGEIFLQTDTHILLEIQTYQAFAHFLRLGLLPNLYLTFLDDDFNVCGILSSDEFSEIIKPIQELATNTVSKIANINLKTEYDFKNQKIDFNNPYLEKLIAKILSYENDENKNKKCYLA